MHENSKLIFEKYGRPYFAADTKVLEIGPDTYPSSYQRAVGTPTESWDTLDFAARDDLELTHRLVSEYSFPVADDSYDVIVSGNVIEHVREVWTWMKEVSRVCRPGGVVITISPITFHHHPAPVDCWRIYPDGMRALCDYAQLDVLVSEYESVERERVINLIPDRFAPKNIFERLAGITWLMNRSIGFPRTKGTFDMVTIARKPTQADDAGK